MKLFDKEEYNKLCAEFLGWNYSQEYESYDDFYYVWEKSNDGVWYKNEDILKDTDTSNSYCKVGNTYLRDYHYSLKFDSDWNWIMEVVENIENLYATNTTLPRFEINSHYASFSVNYPTHKYKKWICGCYETSPEKTKATSKKEAVIQTIWEFLQWYNDKSLNK